LEFEIVFQFGDIQDARDRDSILLQDEIFIIEMGSTDNLSEVDARFMVVGSYVHDKEHGWMEIHPIVRMTEIQ